MHIVGMQWTLLYNSKVCSSTNFRAAFTKPQSVYAYLPYSWVPYSLDFKILVQFKMKQEHLFCSLNAVPPILGRRSTFCPAPTFCCAKARGSHPIGCFELVGWTKLQCRNCHLLFSVCLCHGSTHLTRAQSETSGVWIFCHLAINNPNALILQVDLGV